jgi:antitoxin component YwqK of YwqJK toxin-antitoxin module
MLTETKTDMFHYFIDDEERYQGEYKDWHDNGQLCEHCFYVNDELHGEYKWLNDDGTLEWHQFWNNGKLYRDLLANPVDNKDKFIIALETGGGWLC